VGPDEFESELVDRHLISSYMTKILFLGESHKDGNDSGDSSGDDSDFGDMEDGEEGDEGKRRKNASQQRYKYFSFTNRAFGIQILNSIFPMIVVTVLPITLSGRSCSPFECNLRSHFISFLTVIITFSSLTLPSISCSLLPSHSAKAKNREHAKNTRIRKKHYIEALKESLKLLFDERDKIDKDRRSSLSRLAEQANVRKQVLQTMFFYRASAETSLKRWGSILDDNFQLVLPITPYRSFPPAEVSTITQPPVSFHTIIPACGTRPHLYVPC
jgi:hypothetical protein